MGREFLDWFEQWADSYDTEVSGDNKEYREVFRNYNKILEQVAEHSFGTVMEFGVGTGNLTEKLMQRGLKVIGIEPSEAMRKKTLEKIPNLLIYDGDFLEFPHQEEPINTIVSTYAFHHLTDDEKLLAIQKYSQLLTKGSKIVFADTVFENEEARQQILLEAEQLGYHNLLNDLKTEYYTLIPKIRTIFESCDLKVEFKRYNQFVWIIEAIKKNLN